MTCSCFCHDLSYGNMTYYLTSKFMPSLPCCPSCAVSEDPAFFQARAENLDVFVTDLSVQEESVFHALTYVFVARAPMGVSTSEWGPELKVVVRIAKELLLENYLDAMEQARHQAAKHFNDHFEKNGQPLWIRERLRAWYTKGHKPSPLTPKQTVAGSTVTNTLARQIPGLSETVSCPVKTKTPDGGDCPYVNDVMRIVVHLNDNHRWTREQVADWLETLDVDLSFPSEIVPPAPPHRGRSGPGISYHNISVAEVAAQTADLQQWQSSDGTVLASLPSPASLHWGAASAGSVVSQIQTYMKLLYDNAGKKSAAPPELLGQWVNTEFVDEIHHEQPADPKQYALDLKKQSAHTHFTVNPTKKSPFKK